MKRAIKQKSTIYKFLEPYLESGNEEAIAHARKEYWRAYKASWRNAKRKRSKEITTTWNKEELIEIATHAKRSNMSKAEYIKLASLAYGKRQYLVPNYPEIRQISQILGMLYNINYKALYEDAVISSDVGKVILEKLYEWERMILPLLHNPQLNLETK